jgi:hypothetical protein
MVTVIGVSGINQKERKIVCVADREACREPGDPERALGLEAAVIWVNYLHNSTPQVIMNVTTSHFIRHCLIQCDHVSFNGTLSPSMSSHPVQ